MGVSQQTRGLWGHRPLFSGVVKRAQILFRTQYRPPLRPSKHGGPGLFYGRRATYVQPVNELALRKRPFSTHASSGLALGFGSLWFNLAGVSLVRLEAAVPA